MNRKTLILSSTNIKSVINMKDALRAVEKAFLFYGRDLVQMPAKIYLHLDKYNGDFRAMPAYIKGMEACGLKWVNVHPKNSRFNLPAVMAVIILNNPKDGFPLCIMDGTLITNFRTGAAGAVAAKYLARKNSEIVGLIGCGVQAKTQIMALKELFKIRSVNVWGSKIAYAKKFLKDTAYLGINMEIKSKIYECVRNADIIVTTTPSRKPLVKYEWIKPGAHVNAIGADARGKEELDPELLKKAKIIIDDWQQASHSGEINVPLSKRIIRKINIYATLGEVVSGYKKGRIDSKEITIFDSTGLAIQDIAVADLVYHRAMKYKIGRQLNVIF